MEVKDKEGLANGGRSVCLVYCFFLIICCHNKNIASRTCKPKKAMVKVNRQHQSYI